MFVKILSQWRRKEEEENFNPYKCECKHIALKNEICFEKLILFFLIKLGTMDGADDNDLEVDETNPDGLGQLWEDDDTKSFYEILIDLLEIVPAILYKDSKAQVEIQVCSIFNSRFLL